MPQTKKHTIFLRSNTRTNLSIELDLQRPRASMSLRRRTASTFINLPGQQSLDLCTLLSLTPAEVQAVLVRSPQIQRYGRRSLLWWDEVGAPDEA